MVSWRWSPAESELEALIGLARTAVTAAPHEPNKWISLADLLSHARSDEDALKTFQEALTWCPTSAEIHFRTAVRLRILGRFEDALHHCRQALESTPGHSEAQRLQLSLQVQTKQQEIDDADLAAATSIDPCQAAVFELLAARLDETGAPRRLIEYCDAALDTAPHCASAIFFKAIALAKLGESGAASQLLALDAVVEISQPDPPVSFDDAAHFHEALADEILSHPTLEQTPRGKTTVGGKQTRSLRSRDGLAIRAVIELIRREVDRYEGCQPKRAFPEFCALHVWAVVLGFKGYQRPHSHPDGCLSGVYYVQAPTDPGTGCRSGPLVIGSVKDEFGISPPWGEREIEPIPGRLVLFPSYAPHATRPSHISGQRISVAFDVLPAS